MATKGFEQEHLSGRIDRKEPGSPSLPIDVNVIRELLPHRYPMLMVDKVVDCVPGEYLTAIKNVTINEPFFNGHFPRKPVMPGVMILEALAQATGLLAFHSAEGRPEPGSLFYLVGIDHARFKRPVAPGDQLILHVQLLRVVRGIWKFSGQARVNDQIATQAELMCCVDEKSGD